MEPFLPHLEQSEACENCKFYFTEAFIVSSMIVLFFIYFVCLDRLVSLEQRIAADAIHGINEKLYL